MAFIDDAKKFTQVNDGCGTQATDGRLVLAPLIGCETTPRIYTLTPAVATLGANSVTVTPSGGGITLTTVIWLEKGRVLKFGTNEVVVAERTKLTGTTAQAIPVESLTAALAVTDTALAISALEVISASDMPISFATETENSDRLSTGLQGDTDITKIRLNSQMSLFVRNDDAGVWEKGFGFQSATGVITLYAFLAHANDSLHVFGPCQFHGFEIANATAALKKISTNVVFKPTWYATTNYTFLEAGEKTSINNLRNQFGLAAKV